MTDHGRVADFRWRDEGLGQWSTEAIFSRLKQLKIATDPDSFRREAQAAGGPSALTDLWCKRGLAPGLWEDFFLHAPLELWKRLLADVPCAELLFEEIGDMIEREQGDKPFPGPAPVSRRCDTAMRLAALAVARRPDDPAAWYKEWEGGQYWGVTDWAAALPWELAREGKIEQAESLCRAWARLADTKMFLGDLGVLLAKAGLKERAAAQVQENLRLFAADFWILVHAGDAYRGMGDLEGALEFFERSRRFAGDREDHLALLDREIEALEALGRAAQADELRRRAEELERREPDGPDGDESMDDEEAAVAPPAAKVGRNDPCPCASGRKYKECRLAA